MNLPAFRRPVPVVLRTLLSLGFLGAAIGKFLPQSGWDARFASWGYPTWFVPVVGTIELLGVIGLWLPRVSQQAMVLLTIVLLEASYANLSHPPVLQAVRPAVFLLLMLGLFITQRMPRPDVGANAPA